jgi:type II secretion system protein L
MSLLRVRASRDTPETGEFDWLPPGSARAQRWRPGDAPLAAECHLVVPSDLVTLQSVEVPPAQADRIGASLRYLIEDRMISEPERTHVASVRIAKDRLGIAIVDREWLQGTLARLRQAGAAPRAAYAECLLPPCPAETWTVVSGAGETFARTGPWSGLSLGATDAAAPPDALRLRLAEAAPKRLLLRAAPEGAAPDARAWSEKLGVAVQGGPAWDWTREWDPALDLLQGEFAPRAARRSGERLRRVVFLALAALALFSTGIAAEWFVKARQRAALIDEMARLHRETLGERVPVVDPPAQMRQAVAVLRRASGQALPGDFVALLSTAFSGPDAPRSVRIHQIAYDGATLALLVAPADAKRLVAPAEKPELELTTEQAEWGGQPAVRVKLRHRAPR